MGPRATALAVMLGQLLLQVERASIRWNKFTPTSRGSPCRLENRFEASAPFKGDGEPRSEWEIIEVMLAESRGRVSGPSGAAAKLRIPPSTLDHRIRALKINKRRFKFGWSRARINGIGPFRNYRVRSSINGAPFAPRKSCDGSTMIVLRLQGASSVDSARPP